MELGTRRKKWEHKILLLLTFHTQPKQYNTIKASLVQKQNKASFPRLLCRSSSLRLSKNRFCAFGKGNYWNLPTGSFWGPLRGLQETPSSADAVAGPETSSRATFSKSAEHWFHNYYAMCHHSSVKTRASFFTLSICPYPQKPKGFLLWNLEFII